METSAEFDPQEIVRIVEDALRSSNGLHASFLDVGILEKLYELLPKYMDPADVSYMLSQIRKDIYQSFRIPTSEQLHRVISKCIKCEGEFSVDPQVPKWNVVDPDLVVVAINPMAVDPYGELLVKGLTTAGFKSDRCCLTYVTRCPAKDISAKCLSNCTPYLHTEIHTLRPKLIMSLGLDAYSHLSGDGTSKLKEVIGNVKWFGLYPILPQYSLGFVDNMVKKNQGNPEQFLSIFQQAHRFIYNS